MVLESPLPQPAWDLPVIANGSGRLSPDSQLGRVTYIDFWASWCGPCRLSLPALNRLQKEFDPSDFSIVAISVDYVDEDALDFLKRYPQPTDADIDANVTNICRCGTYVRIRKAIHRAAELAHGDES